MSSKFLNLSLSKVIPTTPFIFSFSKVIPLAKPEPSRIYKAMIVAY